MAIKHKNEDGSEIEVYTADDVKAATVTAVTAATTEFNGVKTKLEGELTTAQTALAARAGEFKQFRELNKDLVDKLGVAERTIYENQLAQHKQQEERIESEKKAKESLVDASLRAKAGTDEKLFKKLKDTYTIIGVEANTPAEIEKKTMMVLGALNTSEPNLLAGVAGFQSGSWTPPVAQKEGSESFADTERGKAGAKELGIVLEIPKK